MAIRIPPLPRSPDVLTRIRQQFYPAGRLTGCFLLRSSIPMAPLYQGINTLMILTVTLAGSIIVTGLWRILGPFVVSDD